MISESNWVRLAYGKDSGQCRPMTRERGEEWLAGYRGGGNWYLVDVPHCRVCGQPATVQGEAIRCERHVGRNPCAIEGCTRGQAVPASGAYRDDQVICSTHWRSLVPARSRARRAHHAHLRRAKKLGWDDRRAEAFWRFWDRLVAMTRRRAGEGFVDEAEINRIMGWGD